MTLDITIPQKNVYNEKENEEEDQEENEEEDDTIEMANGDDTSTVNDDTDKTNTVNPIMHTLDVCMEVFFKYMREFCFANDRLQIESLRILYIDILRIFETIILPTQATRCVQYIMFYICSFKPIVAEMFVDWLWRKMNNPNLSIILRKSVVYYISSLCANASFITSE
jgi:RNA polymerase I-specific transcription initiation factor RRN3